MAKIQIKSEKLTPFGGIFWVMAQLGLHIVLTSSLRTPKVFVKEFSYFLMSCHQHGLGVNLLVQR